MSPKEADKVIKAGKPITVYNDYFRETITFIPVSRDRWNIIGSKGEKFDRGELKILKENPDKSDYDVPEVVLDARWTLWEKGRYVLEVYVADKWRGAGYIIARKPRKLTMADLKKVAKSVRINTGGDITVIGLELEE
jgi:hypothetical protein